MPMNLKNILQIKNKLNFLMKEKDVIDIILFGSAIKGKLNPGDIDIAIITEKQFLSLSEKLKDFHVSNIQLKEFFVNPPTIINTLLREGYSLKHNKYLAESFNFLNRVLFNYSLTSLTPSKKVNLVNLLRGSKGEKGLVEKNGGEWLANQVFIVPVDISSLFEEIFNNFNINFKRRYVLLH